VEEIIAFAKRIGAKKIGIATCIGLMNEAKIFAKILKAKGLESYSFSNPILQARLLHDSLFIKYSKAPVTTLITKDRVLGF